MIATYLIHVSWKIDVPNALSMLDLVEPRAHRTFYTQSKEQPSEVVIKKIARMLYKETGFDGASFTLHAITKIDPAKLIPRDDLIDIDNKEIDIE